MDQLVLLCVDSVCTKLGVQIPWNEVAKEVKPGLTGEAIKQHLAKVYKYRIETGFKVPEKADRKARRQVTSNRVAGSRGKKQRDDTDEDEPKKIVKPGASLLYIKPTRKRKTQKNATALPKTPAPARGRKKIVDDDDAAQHEQMAIKIEDYSDDDFEAPKSSGSSSLPRSNKRERKAKPKEIDYIKNCSPSKRLKPGGYLRAQPTVNYSEPAADDPALDAVYEEDGPKDDAVETPGRGSGGKDIGKSLGSNTPVAASYADY